MSATQFLNSKAGGYLVLGVIAVAGVWYLKNKAGAVVNAVNPLNNDNVINKGYTALVGGDKNASTISDYAFGAIDLVNPFNTDDSYARSVYGLDFKLPSINLDKINPVSQNNVVNQAATAVVGQDAISKAADYVFGLFDLINPFNASDALAKKTYGIGDTEDQRNIANNQSEGINK